jgi:hypothetical protein
MHYYNVEQLIAILRLTMCFTDFASEGLSRDQNASICSGDLSPDYFKGILLKVGLAIIEVDSKDIGTHFKRELDFDFEQWSLSLRNMFGNSNIQAISYTPEFTTKLFKVITIFIDSNPRIDEFNQQLGLNSDDWSIIIKYAFRNTTLINKKSKEAQRNWLTFSNRIMMLCLNEAQMNDPSDIVIDDPFSKYIKYPNISGEFKNFIGQLIKDNCIKEAEAIHLMLQYCRKIVTTENGVPVDKLSAMVSDVFLKGLEIFDAYDQNIIKTGNVSQLERYMRHLKIFTPGFTYVLQDSAFSVDFSIENYLGCRQSYVLEEVMEETKEQKREGDVAQKKPKKEGMVGKLAQLRLSDISKKDKKYVEGRNIIFDESEPPYSTNPIIISSSPRITESVTNNNSPNSRDGIEKKSRQLRKSESPF